MIEVAVNGTPFVNFIRMSVTLALSSLANDFSFAASAVGDFPPLKQGDSVTVLIDRQKVLTGFIDEVSGRETENTHIITYSGRDKTGDIIDSQIDALSDIRASDSLTLKKLIEIVIAHLEVSIDVESEFNPPAFDAKEDIIAPQVGESAVGFILKYARKRQAILTSTPEGNILITQSRPTDSLSFLQHIEGSSTNNILTQNWQINGSALYNKYVRRGQVNPRALNTVVAESAPSTVSGTGAIIVDTRVRVGRQQVNVESESYSEDELLERAKWAKQQAQATATTFSCTVPGHVNSHGDLWEPNTLVQINSDVADISRKMLLNLVTFTQSEGAGSLSIVEFIEKDVYTLDEKIKAKRATGDQNDAFKALG